MTKARAAGQRPQTNNVFVKQHCCGRSCVFTTHQLKAVLDAANKLSQFGGTLLSTLALSGVRITEIVTVRWRNVRADELVLEPPLCPEKPARRVACPKLMDLLREWREAQSRERPVNLEDFVFRGRKHETHISRQTVDLVLRQLFEKLKIQGAPTHSFRFHLAQKPA